MSQYFATTARGIEPVTAEELKRLGASKIELGHGGVHFEGDQELLYRANLELRTAMRVLKPLREFSAKTPEMLYDQVRRIKWEELLNPDMTFAVDCTIAGQKSLSRPREEDTAPRSIHRRPMERNDRPGLNHSRYAALKIKDGIVDQLRMKQGARPNVDTENPDIKINAYLHAGRCTLSLDASGRSLHERGYRVEGEHAPLKETLAAAIIELTGWTGETPLIDPMCGSGTLVLEAGLKALDIAPGLFRDRFSFFGWPDFDEDLWRKLHDSAQERVKKRVAPIVGSDRDRFAAAAANENCKRAGLTKAVHIERRELNAMAPIGDKPGVIVMNPPYGERLGEERELEGLYKLVGDLFKQRMKGWTGYIFTGNLSLAKHVGLRTSRRFELYNGAIECRLLKYDMY